ncbi:MAG: hypothetical protein ACFFBD_11580 [Candidatus Hodarchaeota archaeon]
MTEDIICCWPFNIIKEIQKSDYEEKGILAIVFALVIDVFIVLPLFLIIFISQLINEPGSLIGNFQTAVSVTLVVLFLIPVLKIFLDGSIIYLLLRFVFKTPVPYFKTMMARTSSLIPFILLLPAKALFTVPTELPASFFWPYWTGIIIAFTKDFIPYPASVDSLAIEATPLNFIKLAISILLLLWVMIRTVGLLAKLGDIKKMEAFKPTIVQLIIWDFVSLALAITFLISFA